jgi:Flp pilus assembly protein TadD
MTDRDSAANRPRPEAELQRLSTRVDEEVAFALQRASQMFAEGKVDAARAELTEALSQRSEDPKNQDTLAALYVRLGLYPMAIDIYEALLRDHPRDATLRQNLAVCFLKTGQFARARAMLDQLVQERASDRLFGYLGYALERMGEFTRAAEAYERGGFTSFAERSRSQEAGLDTRTPSMGPPGLRAAAAQAFTELSMDRVAFARAEDRPSGTLVEGWSTLEPGRSSILRETVHETTPAPARVAHVDPLGRAPAAPDTGKLPDGSSHRTAPPVAQAHDLLAQARNSGPVETRLPQSRGGPLSGFGRNELHGLVRFDLRSDGEGARGALYPIAAYTGDLTFERLPRDRVRVVGNGSLWVTPHPTRGSLHDGRAGMLFREDCIQFGPDGDRVELGGETAFRRLLAGGDMLLDTGPISLLDLPPDATFVVRLSRLVAMSMPLVVTDLLPEEAPLHQLGLVQLDNRHGRTVQLLLQGG